MKKFIALLFVFYLCSCTNSKYKYEIKYADTEEIADSGYLKIAESIFYKGEDAVAYIQILPVEVKDTTYNFISVKQIQVLSNIEATYCSIDQSIFQNLNI